MDNQFEISIIDSIIDGRGIRNTRKFLKNIMEKFAYESLNFYEQWGEFPFIYKEKQLNSVLIPAIHNYTGNIWLEQPFKKNEVEQRFLDITTTTINEIFFIELKQAWIKNDSITSKAKREWKTAINQIEDITEETLGQHFDEDKQYKAFKIALIVLPTALISHNINENILKMSAYEYAVKLYENCEIYSKKDEPNFIGTIKFKNSKKYEHEFDNQKNEIYPFISFIAKVDNVW